MPGAASGHVVCRIIFNVLRGGVSICRVTLTPQVTAGLKAEGTLPPCAFCSYLALLHGIQLHTAMLMESRWLLYAGKASGLMRIVD